MNINKQKKNLIFITFAIVFSILISIFSYFYIISIYSESEKNLNYKNNINLIKTLDKDIKSLQNTTKDYAKWDDTYEFAENKNEKYLNDNFKQTSSTLKNLQLDILFIHDLNYKELFSLNNNKSINTKSFQKELILKFKNVKNISTIIEFEEILYLISKEEIFNTNLTKKTNGYFYFIKQLKEKDLKEFGVDIFNINHLKNTKTNKKYKLKSKIFNKIIYSYEFKDEYIYNDLHFFNNDIYTFSLETKMKYQILKDAKNKIFIFNIIIIVLLISIFFLIYKYQKFINVNKKVLERLVSIKTTQIRRTLNNLQEANEKLYHLAHTDDLTKINNRRNFFLLSQKEFLYANENNENFSMIMIDLDNFKNVNDTYGHDVGDKVLITFVKTISKYLKEEDIFGRLGGEEFAISLANTHLEAACLKAELLRAALEKVILSIEKENIKITASFGVSDKQDCNKIDEILLKADKLLYDAKKTGKNKVRSRLG